jgi:hypothetical protein
MKTHNISVKKVREALHACRRFVIYRVPKNGHLPAALSSASEVTRLFQERCVGGAGSEQTVSDGPTS